MVVLNGIVSCVVQRCNCLDRCNVFSLSSGDINSLSVGCLFLISVELLLEHLHVFLTVCVHFG